MSNLIARLSGIATLALAAIPALALTQAAHAAPAPVSIEVADLDLSRATDIAQFEVRLQAGAAQFCQTAQRQASRYNLVPMNRCIAEVRYEALEQLSAEDRQSVAAAAQAPRPTEVARR